MYTIEKSLPIHKFTEVSALPYNKAFTLKDYPEYIYIRVDSRLRNNRVYIIRFSTDGNGIVTFDHPPDLEYAYVTYHDFTLKLLT